MKMQKLSQELKERRKKLGLSQAKLCQFLNIPLPTYEKFEAGRRAIPKTQAHKISMFKKVTDEKVLLAIYHNETLKDLCSKQGSVEP
jgi:transcriptional regulator with XRE-family HTH domain